MPTGDSLPNSLVLWKRFMALEPYVSKKKNNKTRYSHWRTPNLEVLHIGNAKHTGLYRNQLADIVVNRIRRMSALELKPILIWNLRWSSPRVGMLTYSIITYSFSKMKRLEPSCLNESMRNSSQFKMILYGV